MKLIQQPILALTLLLPATIAGLPASRPPTEELQAHRPNWTFDLFHKKHCIGNTVTYAGQGSSGCRSNLVDGGAEAFINVNIDPSCKVKLFRDKKCSRHAMVEEIKTQTTTKCKPISRKKTAQSFEVSCQP
ncbi:hypothetical protein PEX1_041090 [Penicillium expansum]|uniref:Uncharacterized protein n=1 Tax=Penicillium expansum TaxID=27334 RepID=A0A0A2JTQ4_PENEN|nr:hypothetical protein PEX2_091670 [Penicillium expansum]KGO47772.1 hypothetical protein PEXP_069900 [Penicillium expansum]KGO53936.1 hypothetical protein PEX1_041090 [Penicillium expansum]KGO58789.1 hypothetical protein PEX2_091670 [Penicillium expansum]